MAIFRREPPQQGRRMQGGMKKIMIFDQYLALSRKWCKIEPFTMEGEYETVPNLSNGTDII